jgi:hypothetical protein
MVPGLDGRTNNYLSTAMTRDCALDQKQISLCIDPYDLEVLYGAANVTHMTRHLLTFEDAARRLVLAYRTGGSM